MHSTLVKRQRFGVFAKARILPGGSQYVENREGPIQYLDLVGRLSLGF